MKIWICLQAGKRDCTLNGRFWGDFSGESNQGDEVSEENLKLDFRLPLTKKYMTRPLKCASVWINGTVMDSTGSIKSCLLYLSAEKGHQSYHWMMDIWHTDQPALCTVVLETSLGLHIDIYWLTDGLIIFLKATYEGTGHIHGHPLDSSLSGF